MSRKGTRGYTIPGGTAQILRDECIPFFSSINGFCYQYILLNMKSSLTNGANDLKCHKIFLEHNSEVK